MVYMELYFTHGYQQAVRAVGANRSVPGMAAEDENPTHDWQASIQELLLAGGYFRARLPTLPPFDKARIHPPQT